MELQELFLKNKPQLEDYFKKVKVSNQLTTIKFGGNEADFGVTFIIEGLLNEEKGRFEDKVKALFNTKKDLTIVNTFAKNIKNYEVIAEAPFLKISDKPLLHAFQITFKQI